MNAITKNQIKLLLPKRKSDSHKGTYGKIMIIGGSHGMVGASLLSTKAAQRSGTGLVYVSVPEDLFPIIHVGVPEAVCCGRVFEMHDEFLINMQDSIAIGPGLGTSADAKETVKKILDSFFANILLDADALNIVAEEEIDLSKKRATSVITPHVGEAARLLDSTTDIISADREAAVLNLAKKFDCIAVLKGHNTLVAEPGGDIYINYTGNPGMATAGSGDVLAGIITSFMGQGLMPLEAALAGVYTHGLAGDIAVKEKGEYGLIASDIAEAIPSAILDIQMSS